VVSGKPGETVAVHPTEKERVDTIGSSEAPVGVGIVE
jgi:hypothetical protein